MNTIYVLDTSTIIYHPFCYRSFKKNTVVIPIPVLEELDKLKSYADETGKNARTFLRTIDHLIRDSAQKIHHGIKIEHGITLKIDTNLVHNDTLGSALYGDNRILSYTLQAAQLHKKVVLVSKDIGLRVRANSYGIIAEDYERGDASINDNPSAVKEFRVGDDDINTFYRSNMIEISDQEIADLDLKANQFVALRDKNGNSIAHARFISDKKMLRGINKNRNAFGIVAKNLEQQLALDLLMDNDVKLVMLAGKSGSGKTILSLAAGLYNVLEAQEKRYEKLVIIKPMVSVGREMGFLPGTAQEKMEPYIASYKDNLNVILRNSRQAKTKGISADPYITLMIENGTIEIEAVSFLRGRSLPNCFILVDESQNLNAHELKTILTRVGEGTKIVLLGDEEQIDAANLNAGNNALHRAISKFNNYSISGSVIINKGERSALASLAAEIL